MKQCDDCGSYYSEGSSYCPCCGVKNDEYDEDYLGFDDDYNEDNYNEEEF